MDNVFDVIQNNSHECLSGGRDETIQVFFDIMQDRDRIPEERTIHLPTQTLTEYNAAAEGKVYLFTGSKITGGFCVTRKGLFPFSL